MVGSFSPRSMAAQPSEMLMHELLVHKVELEMQNEELRRAHAELEAGARSLLWIFMNLHRSATLPSIGKA